MPEPFPPSDPLRWPTPRLVMSRCLEVEACRYDGRVIRSRVVRSLEPWVELVTVCPEVELGLGVPRDPIRLVRIEERTHLVQPSTGDDLTHAMRSFRDRWLGDVGPVDGFLLKSRSPSCGIDGVSVYAGPEDAPPVGREPGLFAAAVLERFPDTPVEHEGRLTDRHIGDRFLTAVFAVADLRRVVAGRTIASLADFQARHELTLMARSPGEQRRLGGIVANAGGRPLDEVLEAYQAAFRSALRRDPGPTAHVNVIQHAQGYFEDDLSAEEKRHFLHLQEEYRAGRVGRGSLLAVLRSWVHRFGGAYLARQSYLSPYPPELLDPVGPGGGAR